MNEFSDPSPKPPASKARLWGSILTIPEPQLAAVIILGLWRTRFQAMRRYSDGKLKVDQIRAAVKDEIRRAGRIADTGISSFDLVLHRPPGPRQLQEAAFATIEVRRQVMLAVKQARAEWAKVVAEMHQYLHADDSRGGSHQDRAKQRGLRQQQMRTAQREIRASLRARQQEIREQARRHRKSK